MTRKKPSNLAASVRQRLMNVARQQSEDFQLVLTRYLIERLLYRLSQSPHSPRFLLKGALLFTLWTGWKHRPTRDLDLLGQGDAGPEALANVFHDLCSLDVQPDGVKFAADTVTVEAIREDQEYQGQRVHLVPRPITKQAVTRPTKSFSSADGDSPISSDFNADSLRIKDSQTYRLSPPAGFTIALCACKERSP